MGTNIEGNGPDAFGLTKGGGNGMIGGTGTGKGAKGSKYGGYSSQVQNSVIQALRNHKKTQVRLIECYSAHLARRQWSRDTRYHFRLFGPTQPTDAALRNEILPQVYRMQLPLRKACRCPSSCD
jgi:hypothetical protein